LQPAVPAGWTAALGASSITVAPGTTTTTTMTVSSPTSAPEGFNVVSMTATDGAGRSSVGSGTYVVTAGVATTVVTDKTAYGTTDAVKITSTVRSGGAAVSGAVVTVSVTKANGSVVTMNGTTGADGRATMTLRLKRQDPAGMYQVLSKAKLADALTGQASTSFRVQ